MEGITQDRLLDGRVTLLQPGEGYRAAIDPVFLAAAVPARAGEMVLDVGSGVGAASLCLATRVPGCRVVGIEVQAPLVALARQNAEINGMHGRVEPLIGNLRAPPPRLAPSGFDHVMTNPPYGAADSGTASRHGGKALANHESEVDLALWMRAALHMLRSRGTLVVVHRADRLDDLLAALRGSVGEIVVFPLWPKQGRAAKRVLLRARKGVGGGLALLPGMVLHEDNGAYTADAEAVLRHGAALE